MNNLKSKGSFLLNKEQVAIIKKDFSAKKINDKQTIEIIKNFSKKDMIQSNDIASICSNLLTLPNSSIPFEIALNCQLETNI